jgi:hypothetical protein
MDNPPPPNMDKEKEIEQFVRNYKLNYLNQSWRSILVHALHKYTRVQLYVLTDKHDTRVRKFRKQAEIKEQFVTWSEVKR